MELLWEKNWRLLAVSYFCKKIPSWLFDMILNTLLLHISRHSKMTWKNIWSFSYEGNILYDTGNKWIDKRWSRTSFSIAISNLAISNHCNVFIDIFSTWKRFTTLCSAKLTREVSTLTYDIFSPLKDVDLSNLDDNLWIWLSKYLRFIKGWFSFSFFLFWKYLHELNVM